MFLVLSDLSLVVRRDVEIDQVNGSVYVSGIQGMWVTINATTGKAMQTSTATRLAWPVFNETARAQTAGGWAPDVQQTKKVTILSGRYFARTNMVSGSPAIGAALDVGAGGYLTAGTSAPVAYVIKTYSNYDYLGNTLSAVYDIYVL